MADAGAARRGERDGRAHRTVLELYSAMNNLRTTKKHRHTNTRDTRYAYLPLEQQGCPLAFAPAICRTRPSGLFLPKPVKLSPR